MKTIEIPVEEFEASVRAPSVLATRQICDSALASEFEIAIACVIMLALACGRWSTRRAVIFIASAVAMAVIALRIQELLACYGPACLV